MGGGQGARQDLVIRVIGMSVIGKAKPLNSTPIEAESLKSTPIWDDLE
jgi:hypothetical protein